MLILFFVVVAYVPMFIIGRYLPLRAGYKLFFGLTTPIVFVGLMLINIWLVGKLASGLLDYTVARQQMLGKHHDGGLAGFFVSCPLALIGTYFYYRIFKHYGKSDESLPSIKKWYKSELAKFRPRR